MRQSKQKTIPEWVWDEPIHSHVNVYSTQKYITFYDHRSQLNGLSLNERWQTTKVVLYFVILSACHSSDYRHLSNVKFYLFGDNFFDRFLLNSIIKGQSLITLRSSIFSMFAFSHSIIIYHLLLLFDFHDPFSIGFHQRKL